MEYANMISDRMDARLGWMMRRTIKWLFVPFVLALSWLLPNLRDRQPALVLWLILYAAFLLVLEVLFPRTKLYDTSSLRMIRAQAMILFGSVLVFLTGGAESLFWFFFLWPLFSVSSHFGWPTTWGIYGEVSLLYCVASVLTGGNLTPTTIGVLIVNLAIMMLLAALVGYLQIPERELRYGTILEETQHQIDTAIDLQDVLDRVLSQAVKLIGGADGTLMLLGQTEALEIKGRFLETKPEGKPERTFAPGEGVAGWVLQNRRPYICHDTRTDPRFVPVVPGSVHIGSMLSVPIISHGRILGVISVEHPKVNRFSADDARLLTTLATQTASAIERAELLDSLQEIGEQAAGDAAELYGRIVDAVHRLTHCSVAMWRVRPDGKQAGIVAHKGVRPEHAEKASVGLDNSVTGRAIRNCEIVQVLDIQSEPAFQNKKEAKREGWQSMLAVPLLGVPGQAVGTLHIYSPVKRKGFSRWELDLLRTFAGQVGSVIRTTDLIRDLAVLNQIGQALSSEQSLADLLELILRKAKEIIPFESGGIVLIDEQTGRLKPEEVLGLSESITATSTEPGEGILGWTAKHDHTLRIDDVRDMPTVAGIPEQPSCYPLKEDARSVLCVPLKRKGRVIGVLNVESSHKRAFSERDEERLEILASQAAIAIENARTHENGILQLSALLKIAGAMDTEADPLPIILEEVAALLKAEYGSFAVWDPQAGHLEFCAVLEKNHMLVGESIPEDKRLRSRDVGIVGHVSRTGQAYYTGDAAQDPHYSQWYEETMSELAVPLRDTMGKTMGVLNLESPIANAFSQTQQSLCQDFASVAAIVVEKTQLLRKLTERAARLEQLQKVMTLIPGDPFVVQTRLDMIVGSLSNMFAGAPCAIRLYDATRGRFDGRAAAGDLDSEVSFDPRAGGSSRFVIETKSPLYVSDTSYRLPSGSLAIREGLAQQGVQAAARVPLLYEETAIGVLYVNMLVPHEFSQNDKHILELFANQAAVALQNARQYDQRRKDIAALQEINAAITTSEWSAVAQLIASAARELTNADCGTLWLVNAGATTLALEAVQGPQAEIAQLGVAEDSISGWVALTGEPYNCPNVREDPHHTEVFEDIQSCISVPLKFGNRLIGVLSAESMRVNAFTTYQLGLLQSLADQAAIAIRNSTLFREKEALYGKLERLSHEAVSLIGATTRRELFSRSLDIVSQVFNANAAFYLCEDVDCSTMQLEYCVPESFKSKLRSSWQLGGTPFKGDMPLPEGRLIRIDARSHAGRHEGTLLVQSLDTAEHVAEPFSKSDKRSLFLLARAVGHTLQKLEIDWVFGPLGSS